MACAGLASAQSQPEGNIPSVFEINDSFQSPDCFETYPNGTRPTARPRAVSVQNVAGPIAPASGQPSGALSGRIVFTSAGHGWTYDNDVNAFWFTQRGITWEMVEDYGNQDQMTMFAYYCFNAGATVVGMRPIGHQTNEVVIDNVATNCLFQGEWNNSGSTIYYGATTNEVPYRWAVVSTEETATATYTPNIPVAGFYPVYTWVRHGEDRTNQLYRINHTGGQSTVRVPHHMVGNGWVYLGTYYFNAGANSANGAVIISNLQPTATPHVVIADAIRFGNGMGSIIPTPKGVENPGISTYPREEECSRYWVQNSMGQGQSSAIYHVAGNCDNDDNVGTPPRMAAEMNRETEVTNLYKRIYIGFHSNAAGNTNTSARGTLGLYNNSSLFPGSATPNQSQLASLIGTEVENDLTALNNAPSPLELPWDGNRSGVTYARPDYAFGEINAKAINNEMDATMIEVAFHDNVSDAKLLRDPKFRNWVARAMYQAVVRYMAQYDRAPNLFIPEPPSNVRATATTNGIVLTWASPGTGGSPAAAYVVYSSTDGYGFGNPMPVVGNSITLTNLPADTDLYFRVAATNAGGESLPSETVGCRRSSNSSIGKVLFVNAFTRFDRTTAPRQNITRRNWKPYGNTGAIERVIPRRINSFDYVVQHGKAISAYGMPFDSCHKDAIASGLLNLTNYQIVVWQAGQDLTNQFPAAVQTKLTNYLNNGGNFFVSGSDIAWGLGRASGPTSAERAFLQNHLHATLASNADNDAQTHSFAPAAGSIFGSNNPAIFDDGNQGTYWVQYADLLTPSGSGAQSALAYVGGKAGAAAVQYDGSTGGGKVVFLGFPFETIISSELQNAYLASALNFFNQPSLFAAATNLAVMQSSNATLTVRTAGAAPFSLQWKKSGLEIAGATNNVLALTDIQFSDAGTYSLVMSNAYGSVETSITLTVLPQPGAFDSITLGADNQLQLLFRGSVGVTYTLEESTNLINWSPLTNCIFTNNAVLISVPVSNRHSFYRGFPGQ